MDSTRRFDLTWRSVTRSSVTSGRPWSRSISALADAPTGRSACAPPARRSARVDVDGGIPRRGRSPGGVANPQRHARGRAATRMAGDRTSSVGPGRAAPRRRGADRHRDGAARRRAQGVRLHERDGVDACRGRAVSRGGADGDRQGCRRRGWPRNGSGPRFRS